MSLSFLLALLGVAGDLDLGLIGVILVTVVMVVMVVVVGGGGGGVSVLMLVLMLTFIVGHGVCHGCLFFGVLVVGMVLLLGVVVVHFLLLALLGVAGDLGLGP